MFSLIRRQAMVVGVRSARVVKTGDVGEQALLELLNGQISTPIQLLLF